MPENKGKDKNKRNKVITENSSGQQGEEVQKQYCALINKDFNAAMNVLFEEKADEELKNPGNEKAEKQ